MKLKFDLFLPEFDLFKPEFDSFVMKYEDMDAYANIYINSSENINMYASPNTRMNIGVY